MNLIHNPPQCLLAGSTAHQGFTRPFSSAIADRELTFLSSSEFSSTLCVHACVCVCVCVREKEKKRSFKSAIPRCHGLNTSQNSERGR